MIGFSKFRLFLPFLIVQNLIKTHLFLANFKVRLLFKSVHYWRGYKLYPNRYINSSQKLDKGPGTARSLLAGRPLVKCVYRESQDSTNLITTIPGLVWFLNRTKPNIPNLVWFLLKIKKKIAPFCRHSWSYSSAFCCFWTLDWEYCQQKSSKPPFNYTIASCCSRWSFRCL